MATVTEVLIDFSGSMKDKLALTKGALLNLIIPKLDFSSQIGVKTFNTGEDKKISISQLHQLSITNQEQLIKSINALGVPNGGTPLAQAIRQSVISLSEFQSSNKILVVVTDGEETEKGNPAMEVKNAKEKGVDLQMHWIQIGESEKTKLLVEEIKKISTCSFSNIPFDKQKASYNEASVKPYLANFFNSVSAQTISKPPSTSISKATSSQIASVTEKQPVTDNRVAKPIDEAGDNTLLKIQNDIKIIKEQLLELKDGKALITEPIEDPILNEQIRKRSEEYLLEVLNEKYPNRVTWLNKEGESYNDHDFEIVADNSVEYYIECKGTTHNKQQFFLTKSEWWLFLNNTKNYQIYFVKNTSGKPSHIFIDNLLDWLLKGKIVPYLLERTIVPEERIYLTINQTTFQKEI